MFRRFVTNTTRLHHANYFNKTTTTAGLARRSLSSITLANNSKKKMAAPHDHHFGDPNGFLQAQHEQMGQIDPMMFKRSYSAEEDGELEEQQHEVEVPKKKRRKKRKKDPDAPKQKTGLTTQLYNLSDEMAAVVGAPVMTRADVVKYIWVYIKEHNLQKEGDKRTIVPDEKLKKVIGEEEISMFKMQGKVSSHLLSKAGKKED